MTNIFFNNFAPIFIDIYFPNELENQEIILNFLYERNLQIYTHFMFFYENHKYLFYGIREHIELNEDEIIIFFLEKEYQAILDLVTELKKLIQ